MILWIRPDTEHLHASMLDLEKDSAPFAAAPREDKAVRAAVTPLKCSQWRTYGAIRIKR
jgi:hypothetical protein